jgi:hypothetical protein
VSLSQAIWPGSTSLWQVLHWNRLAWARWQRMSTPWYQELMVSGTVAFLATGLSVASRAGLAGGCSVDSQAHYTRLAEASITQTMHRIRHLLMTKKVFSRPD